jgi:DNA mismatch repair protein MutL
MSDVIQLLPENVANQIAAGEVVQRPASVVKELLENAVDAGATQIRLIVREAGKTLIQVIDNGCGMSETDARMCFERHATSKIRTSQDLFAIRTMGFRGEAMASIGAVAQVELRTRRAIDELGTQILIQNSRVTAQEPCQTPVGTSVSVKNLFFNVPARRNFLKSDVIEMRHIMDEFQRVALANSDVFFSLHHNDQEIFHLPAGNLRQRVVKVLGEVINKKLVPVEEETEMLRIKGFVGKPDYSKKTRGEQYFFVNNRFIKSAYLHHAVVGAYEDLIPEGFYPLYVIFLDLDPSHLDINIHPTKQEIKFDDEKLTYNVLKVSVKHALGSNSVTPTLDFEQDSGFINQRLNNTSYSPSSDSGTISEYTSKASGEGGGQSSSRQHRPDDTRHDSNLRNWQRLYEGLDQSKKEEQDTSPDDGTVVVNIEQWMSGFSAGSGNEEVVSNVQRGGTGPKEGEMDIMAIDDEKGSFTKAKKEPYQIHNQYIVSQIKSGFLLIDQQTASERVLYERYMEALNHQAISTQAALFPRTMDVAPADAVLLRDILPEINRLGFDIAEFGGNTFVIHGHPAELPAGTDEVALVEKMLDQYRNNMTLSLGISENIARSMARNAAIRRGQSLTITEMQDLVDQLFACSIPYKSPFGRNCFITIELDELLKRFS